MHSHTTSEDVDGNLSAPNGDSCSLPPLRKKRKLDPDEVCMQNKGENNNNHAMNALIKENEKMKKELEVMNGRIQELDKLDVERLYEVQEKLKESLSEVQKVIADRYLCIICKDRPKNVLIVECSHFEVCSQCSQSIQDCPICRKKDVTFKPLIH